MKKPKYRLSPNEVERLVKEERERLRKLRIVQVREQSKANAAVIRSQVKNERERLLADFADEVKHAVLAEKDEKIRKLEQKYDSTLRSIGEGHAEVLLNGDGQKIAERLHKRLEDEERAMERYKAAKEKHDREKAQEEWEASRNIRNRNLALEAESQRAAYIASLPPPESDEISFDEKPTHKKAIPMTDMKSFAATHYHIPDYQVVKAGPDEQLYDAKMDAEQADKRLKQDLKEKKISQHEQVEKARIRGNEALHKEMLKHDLSDMMKDLSLLQRKDRRRRQVLLAEVPNQVFIPPERCLQDRADQQVEMERRFEEMYMDKQQKPDASTLQTWSELPAGDDNSIANGDSELSTLESVPLPPYEKALRNLGVKGSKKPDGGGGGARKVPPESKNPDTVLKQLLSKIKEQKMNASTANRKPGAMRDVIVAREKPGKDVDAVSLTSASESRASWKRSTENVDEDSQDEFYPMKDDEEGAADKNGFVDVKSEGSSADTKSSGSKLFLQENSALIDELQQRINKIEEQKLHLAQQLHSQSEFYQELQLQQQELHDLKLLPTTSKTFKRTSPHRGVPSGNSGYDYDTTNNDDDPTLEDVSLPSPQHKDHDDISTAADSGIHHHHRRRMTQDASSSSSKKYSNARNVQVLPNLVKNSNSNDNAEQQQQQQVDLANAMARLRPVAGILKGTPNPRFELLSSNGFLPQSLEGDGDGGGGGGSDSLIENERSSRNMLLQFDNINLVKEGGGGGARRMIDFGGGGGGGGGGGNLSSSRWDKSDHHLPHNVGVSAATDSKGFMAGGDEEEEEGMMMMMAQEDPMRKKIQDYHSRAQELHASMDESTLNKVRDYQQHILQTHQDRKQLLENIRDDIERRRQALNTTSSKFVGTGGAFLMNLASTAPSGGVGGGDGPSSARGQISLPPRSSSIMSASSSYPILSSSGMDSRAVVLSHSQSEKVLEPIKPFIADPWISNKKKQQHQQPSILKPSSDFPTQYDLSEIGIGVPSAPQNPGTTKPPSSIEKIKKSLAFDDLNESNVDASPAFYRGRAGGGGGGGDSLNDTSASRHSQALTDDSKLTTSEEDRGSPVLQGSRSDQWDTTSDNKSNYSVTGSSSLNGSALVAQAEERREGFERRQMELRNQLMDIQHQKEAILMRYYKGQQAIQEQQSVLRNRLLFPSNNQPAVATSSGQGHSVSSSIQQQQQLQQQENWSSKLSKFQSGNSGGSESGAGSDAGSSSFGNDRQSGGKSSSGSVGSASLNLTGDAYLEDISYHQVKGTDEPTVPLQLPVPEPATTSATTVAWGDLGGKNIKSKGGGGGGGRKGGHGGLGVGVTFADDEERMKKFITTSYDGDDYDDDDDDDVDETLLKELPSGGGGVSTSTWASVLSSSSRQGQSQAHRASPDYPPPGMFFHPPGGDTDLSSLLPTTTTTSSSSHDHQTTPDRHPHHHPHELSTILEVDTPTATATESSLAGSSVRLAGAGGGGGPSLSVSQQSLQSLYSQGSVGTGTGISLPPYQYRFDDDAERMGGGGGGGGGGSKSDLSVGSMGGAVGGGAMVDPFPDLPQVLLSQHRAAQSQRGYNLATGGDGIISSSYYRGVDDDDDDGDYDPRGEEDNDYNDYNLRGEGDGGVTLTSEVSLGAGSSCYTLESEPAADVESNLDLSGGFNLSQ